MPYKISGTKSETARVIVFKESDWSIEANTVISGSGDYEVVGVVSGTKSVIGRNDDGWVEGYGLLEPVHYGPISMSDDFSSYDTSDWYYNPSYWSGAYGYPPWVSGGRMIFKSTRVPHLGANLKLNASYYPLEGEDFTVIWNCKKDYSNPGDQPRFSLGLNFGTAAAGYHGSIDIIQGQTGQTIRGYYNVGAGQLYNEFTTDITYDRELKMVRSGTTWSYYVDGELKWSYEIGSALINDITFYQHNWYGSDTYNCLCSVNDFQIINA